MATSEVDPYRDKKKIAGFCKGWTMDDRDLHVEKAKTSYPQIRELFRSGARIAIHTCARGYEQPPMQLIEYDDEAQAIEEFATLARKPPAGFKQTEPFYVEGKRGGTWVRHYGDGVGWVCGTRHTFGAYKDTVVEHADEGSAARAFGAAESAMLAKGIVASYLELDGDIRPDTDILLGEWLENRERADTETLAWHLGAIAAIHAAFAKSFTSKLVSIEVGKPASANDIAAYEKTLPKPLPASLREAWLIAGTMRWRVGKTEARLLSPKEVGKQRTPQRAGLTERFVKLKKNAQPDQWLAKTLDPIIVGTDGCLVALDVDAANVKPYKASTGHVFYATDDASLTYKKPTVYPDQLAYAIAEHFNSDFVDALVEKFPQIKKTKYGTAS